MGYFALLCYLIFSSGFMGVGQFIWKDGSPVMGSVFFLVGLLFFVATVYHFFELVRYGDTHLRLDGAAWRGGKVAGSVRAARRITGTETLLVTLECRKVYARRDLDASGSSVTEDVVWSREAEFPIRPRLAGSECRFEFALPADAEPSTSVQIAGGGMAPGHYWQLHVHADVPGIDLLRSFVVKVAAGPATRLA